jgi:hypothetical protein
VASVPTDDVMLRAPVASVSLFVLSQFITSLRIWSAAWFNMVVSSLSGPFFR